jgi:hypothetical protein
VVERYVRTIDSVYRRPAEVGRAVQVRVNNGLVLGAGPGVRDHSSGRCIREESCGHDTNESVPNATEHLRNWVLLSTMIFGAQQGNIGTRTRLNFGIVKDVRRAVNVHVQRVYGRLVASVERRSRVG